MTQAYFENGYWYQSELKEFAASIGIPSANRLRKDELEKAIVSFLESGRIRQPANRSLSRSGVRDFEKGLRPKLPIVNYTSNKETKKFVVEEARKISPDLKTRSGVWYRLNRWREEQLTRGVDITYADLVKRYVELSQTEGTFARIPHGRYINFVSDFLANEKDGSREDAVSAWKALKEMNIPKDYRSWAEASAKRAEQRAPTDSGRRSPHGSERR